MDLENIQRVKGILDENLSRLNDLYEAYVSHYGYFTMNIDELKRIIVENNKSIERINKIIEAWADNLEQLRSPNNSEWRNNLNKTISLIQNIKAYNTREDPTEARTDEDSDFNLLLDAIEFFEIYCLPGWNGSWTLHDQLNVMTHPEGRRYWGSLVIYGVIPSLPMTGDVLKRAIHDSDFPTNHAGKKVVSADYRRLNLSKGDLSGLFFENVNLDKTNLEGVNLSNSDWYDVFARNATLEGAKVNGTTFDNCYFNDSNLEDITIECSDCTGCDFDGADLMRANFKSCNFRKCNFDYVDMDDANVVNCTFDNQSSTSGISAQRVNFEGVQIKPKGGTESLSLLQFLASNTPVNNDHDQTDEGFDGWVRDALRESMNVSRPRFDFNNIATQVPWDNVDPFRRVSDPNTERETVKSTEPQRKTSIQETTSPPVDSEYSNWFKNIELD